MTRFDQAQQSTAGKEREDAIEFASKTRFREHQFEVSRQRARGFDQTGTCLDQVGEFGEDPCDLGSFFVLQAYPFVIHLQDGERLHENSGIARRTLVNNALHAAFLFRSHGDDESAVPDRNELLLELRGVRWTPKDGFEFFRQAGARRRQGAPDPPKFRTVVFVHFAILYCASEVFAQFAQIGKTVSHRRQLWKLFWFFLPPEPQAFDMREEGLDCFDHGDLQHGSGHRKFFESLRQEGSVVEWDAMFAQILDCLAGDGMLGLEFFFVQHRSQLIEHMPGCECGYIPAKQIFQPVKFESVKGEIHERYYRLIRLATTPAPRPLSMLTTVTLEAQLLSIPSSAAIPLKLAPYPMLVVTAIAGTETRPPTTLGSAPSMPATTITTRAVARRSRRSSRRCKPETPTA